MSRADAHRWFECTYAWTETTGWTDKRRDPIRKSWGSWTWCRRRRWHRGEHAIHPRDVSWPVTTNITAHEAVFYDETAYVDEEHPAPILATTTWDLHDDGNFESLDAGTVEVRFEADTTEFVRQVRGALFRMYQQAQKWGIEEAYHFGVRAREVAND